MFRIASLAKSRRHLLPSCDIMTGLAYFSLNISTNSLIIATTAQLSCRDLHRILALKELGLTLEQIQSS